MDEVIGHKMLNFEGKEILVPLKTLRRLDSQHWLARDKATGLLKFKEELAKLYYLWGPDLELGADMSGPAVCDCRCPRCRKVIADFCSDPGTFIDSSAIVQAVVAKRRFK